MLPPCLQSHHLHPFLLGWRRGKQWMGLTPAGHPTVNLTTLQACARGRASLGGLRAAARGPARDRAVNALCCRCACCGVDLPSSLTRRTPSLSASSTREWCSLPSLHRQQARTKTASMKLCAKYYMIERRILEAWLFHCRLQIAWPNWRAGK